MVLYHKLRESTPAPKNRLHLPPPFDKIKSAIAGVLELADETDSKSVGGNTVRVRSPPPASLRSLSECEPLAKHELSAMHANYLANASLRRSMSLVVCIVMSTNKTEKTGAQAPVFSVLFSDGTAACR